MSTTGTTLPELSHQAMQALSSTAEQLAQAAGAAEGSVERGLKSWVPADQAHLVDEGAGFLKRQLNLPISFSLQSDIDRARNIMRTLRDFPAWIDGGLIAQQIKDAHALAFLTIGRAGLFWTWQVGSGMVIKKLPDGTWSGPAAFSYVGSGLGLQAGLDLTDYVLFLTEDALESFTSSAQLMLGGEAGLSILVGRHVGAGMHVGGSLHPGFNLGWAQSKGWFAGASAQAGMIISRGDANKEFYRRDVTPWDILHGKVPRPRAASALYRELQQTFP